MDEIIHEMSRIYSMFCWPRAILNEQTREVVFEYVWRNSDAEAYYNTLAEILKTQQAAQHGIQPTTDHDSPPSGCGAGGAMTLVNPRHPSRQ